MYTTSLFCLPFFAALLQTQQKYYEIYSGTYEVQIMCKYCGKVRIQLNDHSKHLLSIT